MTKKTVLICCDSLKESDRETILATLKGDYIVRFIKSAEITDEYKLVGQGTYEDKILDILTEKENDFLLKSKTLELNYRRVVPFNEPLIDCYIPSRPKFQDRVTQQNKYRARHMHGRK